MRDKRYFQGQMLSHHGPHIRGVECIALKITKSFDRVTFRDSTKVFITNHILKLEYVKKESLVIINQRVMVNLVNLFCTNSSSGG